MSDPVRVDKASLDALTEAMRSMSARIAKVEAENAELRAENAELRALLAHYKTSLNEQHNDPMESGVCGEQSSAP